MFISPELKRLALRVARWTGRYADWQPGERATRQAEPIWFRGETPPMAGRELNQYRLVFKTAQPLITNARNVTYTQRGMAWLKGRLERRYSFQEVGPRHVWEPPGDVTRTFPRASILQSQTPCTYGDWVSEHLAALALALAKGSLQPPLLIPSYWFAKPYVRRDLDILGVAAEAIHAPVLVECAVVINKTRPGHYWNRAEANAVTRAMGITPRDCRPGSGLYLSRKGEQGEGPKRLIRNDVTESAMEAAGVKVIRTVNTTPAEYRALAESAETLFTDHGSAAYNMMYWKTRRIVELFPPDYWDSAFLFLANALDIDDYHLWQIDEQTAVELLTQRVRTLMREPVIRT